MGFRKIKIEPAKVRKYLPVLLGTAGGFLYYNFVGCVTGSCAITSNPYSSMIFGALIGAAFIKKSNKTEKAETEIK